LFSIHTVECIAKINPLLPVWVAPGKYNPMNMPDQPRLKNIQEKDVPGPFSVVVIFHPLAVKYKLVPHAKSGNLASGHPPKHPLE